MFEIAVIIIGIALLPAACVVALAVLKVAWPYIIGLAVVFVAFIVVVELNARSAQRAKEAHLAACTTVNFFDEPGQPLMRNGKPCPERR